MTNRYSFREHLIMTPADRGAVSAGMREQQLAHEFRLAVHGASRNDTATQVLSKDRQVLALIVPVTADSDPAPEPEPDMIARIAMLFSVLGDHDIRIAKAIGDVTRSVPLADNIERWLRGAE